MKKPLIFHYARNARGRVELMRVDDKILPLGPNTILLFDADLKMLLFLKKLEVAPLITEDNFHLLFQIDDHFYQVFFEIENNEITKVQRFIESWHPQVRSIQLLDLNNIKLN